VYCDCGEHVLNADVIFLSLSGNNQSRTKNYFHGLIKEQVRTVWVDCSIRLLLHMIIGSHRHHLKSKATKLVVASPSHILTIIIFLLLQKRPVLDAGWPLFDGVVLSRRQFGFLGFKCLRIYILDFLAFQFSSKVFVESEPQKRRVSKLYFLPKGKIGVIETGFDENRIEEFDLLPRDPALDIFQVIFRGGNQRESGLEILATSILPPENNKPGLIFRIITNSEESRFPDMNWVKFTSRRLSDQDLFSEYIKSNLALGQLSTHKRLKWTIPHKFFEAAYFGLPYLTANSSLMETYRLIDCVAVFEAGDSFDLIEKIEALSRNKARCQELGSRFKSLYETNFSQKILARKLLSLLYE